MKFFVFIVFIITLFTFSIPGVFQPTALAHDPPAIVPEDCPADHTPKKTGPGEYICQHPETVNESQNPIIGFIDKTKIPFFENIGDLVADIYLLALLIAGIFFLIQFIIGGIAWINSGGDPKALESARNRLQNAIIGLVIVVAAFGVSVIVLSVLGINIFSGGEITIGQ